MLATLLAGSAGLLSPPVAACQPDPIEKRAVTRVLDSETLSLDDGSEVRLVGALGPRPEDANADALFWQPAVSARAALEALVAGRSVTLGSVGRQRDRHGRRLSHVFTATDPPVWVQGYMIENGHARAYALPGAGDCLDALARLEARARDAGLGLWSNAAYTIRPAERTWLLRAAENRFQLVEGRVSAVRQAHGHVTLSFGSGGRRDFSVAIGPEQRRSLAARGIDAEKLSGAPVRIRGWVVRRSGPTIELTTAAELELLEPAADIGVRGTPPGPPR